MLGAAVALIWSTAVAPTLSREAGLWRLRGTPIEIAWDEQTGAPVRVSLSGMVLLSGCQRPFDLRVNGKWALWQAPEGMRLTGVKLTPAGKTALVQLRYSGRSWRAIETYQVRTDKPYMTRFLELQPSVASGSKFDRLEVYWGQISVPADRWQIAVPYTWPPAIQPLAEFVRQMRGFGLHCGSRVTGFCIWSPRAGRAVALGQYWERDFNMLAAGVANGRLQLRSTYEVLGKPKPFMHIPAGGCFIRAVDGGWREGLAAVGQAWLDLGCRPPKRPEWARALVLYSLYPGGTNGSWWRDLGGLANFQRLYAPILQWLGVDAVWFLPLWPGMYAPRDYFAIDPKLGTAEQFADTVRDLHSRGIKVLCDLIPHGPREESGLLQEHPEFVCRNEDGSVKYWWGCLGCDYAHPGWQEYMARVATHWVKAADIDGWRVDVAASSLPNWRPYGSNLPSWSRQWGGLQLMARVRKALDQTKPGCILLAESANPPMLSRAHYIYDWPAENVFYRVLLDPADEWVANILKWLEMERLVLPPGAAGGLMRFWENHDQRKSLWILGPGLARACYAMTSLIEGFPLIYHEQEVGTEDLWRQLIAVRHAVPELGDGSADYLAVTSSVPHVMAFVRRRGELASIVAINFSPKPTTAQLIWRDAPPALRHAFLLPSGRRVSPALLRTRRGLALSVQLAPWGWCVAVLRAKPPRAIPLPPAAALPARTEAARPSAPSAVVALADGRRIRLPSGGARSADQRAGQARAVTISAGGVSVEIRGGLIARLSAGGAELARGMWIGQGRYVVFDAPALLCSHQKPLPPKAWSVSLAEKGVRVAWTSRSAEFELSSATALSASGRLSFRLSLTPLRAPNEPVLGELYGALSCPGADRWHVFTAEGEMGGPVFLRHPTADEMPGKYWHPPQRMWELSLLPLDPRRPCIGWRAGGKWLWLSLPGAAQGLPVETAFLREYSPDGSRALTFYWQWLAGRQGRLVQAGKPFELELQLSIGPPPQHAPVRMPVPIDFNGAAWDVHLPGGTIRLVRSAGMHPVGAWVAGRRLIRGRARIYTDYGIIPRHTDPKGRKVRVYASTEPDLEPDVRLRIADNALEIRAHSYLRGWRDNLAVPRVEYALSYRFDARGVHVRQMARPLMPPAPETRAFLAEMFPLGPIDAWKMKLADGREVSGSPERDGYDRIAETARLGQAAVAVEVTSGPASLAWTDLKPIGPPPQNIFVHRSRSTGEYHLFFAMLDGRPVLLEPRWRGIEYRLRIGRR